MSILFDANTQETLQKTIDISKSYSHEYVTPEHLLLSLVDFSPFALTVRHVNGYPEYIKEDLMNYLDAQEKVDREVKEGEEELSVQMEMLLNESLHTCQNANRDYITLRTVSPPTSSCRKSVVNRHAHPSFPPSYHVWKSSLTRIMTKKSQWTTF